MSVDFNDPAAVVAFYNANYLQDISQGQAATCGTCCLVTAIMARYLFANGVPMPFLSWPYAYYVATGDATFNGTGGGPPVNVWTQGICADALYPQAAVLANWQNGFPYPPEFLPQPPAYADAPNQKIVDFGTLTADVPTTLRAGIPVVFVVGYHAVCGIAASPDGYWIYCKDSLIAGQSTPYGRGIRVVRRDEINPSTMPTPVTTVYWSGQSAGGDLSTQPEVIAAVPAVSPWTPANYAQLQAAVAAAAPGTPPAPVQVPPAASAADGQGHVWSLGATGTLPPNQQVIRDGAQFAGGQAVLIDCRSGAIKVKNSAGDWWAPTFNPDGWTATTAP